jgi:CheY-like chemotaxis protein
VTERKRLDQVLQVQNIELASAKSVAEKANLAKSDFLSNMSHELRSPLNAIIGFAQLMQSEAPPPTSGQLASIDQILEAGWYLLALINEILDLAIIESGRLSPTLEPVSLAEVLSECDDMVTSQAVNHGIATSFPHLTLPIIVLADRTRLKQVLINLLSNAIKYNRPDGTVTVGCALRSKDRIRLTVTDSGAGLSEEHLAQLFQSFNRLGQETGAEEGTGIGLVVSKRLMELMHGEIGVESTVGTGSVFWIELPVAHAVARDEPQAAVSEADKSDKAVPSARRGAATRTLLYVEDNPANLNLIEQVVARRPDLRLLSAGDATYGIEVARGARPDVILMDINLPGISGLEALRILRTDPRTAHIPIIALSANAMPRDVRIGLDAGFFRYLTKPVRIPEFLATLDEALELMAARRRAIH